MNTLDEILNKLSEIIEISIEKNDPIGIFTYVYWRTTEEIKKAIDEGQFEDNVRMEAFDIMFANLFIDAYTKYKNNESIRDSWKIAMESGKDITVIQNILLGMNAHINLDLSITAFQIMAGKSINDLKNDYDKVNDILESLINEMEEKISNTSTLFFLFDWVGGKSDEAIMDFSIRKAREFAWVHAVGLSLSSESEKISKLERQDAMVFEIGKGINKPKGKFLNMALRIIKFFEPNSIDKIINNLKK